jgi:hypothetical protein
MLLSFAVMPGDCFDRSSQCTGLHHTLQSQQALSLGVLLVHGCVINTPGCALHIAVTVALFVSSCRIFLGEEAGAWCACQQRACPPPPCQPACGIIFQGEPWHPYALQPALTPGRYAWPLVWWGGAPACRVLRQLTTECCRLLAGVCARLADDYGLHHA